MTHPLSRGKPSLYQDQVIQVEAAMNKVSSNGVDPTIPLLDPTSGLHLQQQQYTPESAYVWQIQHDPRQPQQQFVQGRTHYVQHQTGSVPITTYYPLYQ